MGKYVEKIQILASGPWRKTRERKEVTASSCCWTYLEAMEEVEVALKSVMQRFFFRSMWGREEAHKQRLEENVGRRQNTISRWDGGRRGLLDAMERKQKLLTDTPCTHIFSCTFHLVFISHCGSRCHWCTVIPFHDVIWAFVISPPTPVFILFLTSSLLQSSSTSPRTLPDKNPTASIPRKEACGPFCNNPASHRIWAQRVRQIRGHGGYNFAVPKARALR